MAKTLTLEQLGKYYTKLQGAQNEVAFAESLGVPRHTLRAIKKGLHSPSDKYLKKLGFEVVYRQV